MDRTVIRSHLERAASHFIDLDFVSKVGSTLITKALLFVFSLAASVLIARVLGPAGRGIYAAAITLSALGVQFGNLGLHASNTYFVAKDGSLLRKLVANTVVVSLCVGGLASGVLALVFIGWPKSAPLSGLPLYLALVGIPVGLLYLLLQNLLLGTYQVMAFNCVEILNRVVNVALLGAAVLAGVMSPAAGIGASLTAAALAAVASLSMLAKDSGFPTPSIEVFRKTLPYGLRAYWSSVFGFFLLRADLMIVKYMLGSEQTGYYSAAVNLAEVILMIPSTVALILFPKLTAMTDPAERWIKTRNIVVLVGAIMAVLALATALGSSLLIRALFGVAFLPASSACRWLMPGIVFVSMTTILASYMASISIPLRSIAVYLVVSAANVALNFLWLPQFGIVGAALASTVCYAGSFVGLLWVALRFKSRDAAIVSEPTPGSLPDSAAG